MCDAALKSAAREGDALPGMPSGEPIRRALSAIFKGQSRRAEKAIREAFAGRKADRDVPDGPGAGPAARPTVRPFIPTVRWDAVFGPVADEFEPITPMLRVIWQDAGEGMADQLAPYRVDAGLDPQEWSVTNPRIGDAINQQVFDFAESTNATTRLELEDAHAKLRETLREGMTRGDVMSAMVKWVKTVFVDASTYRARRIARTESARAYNAARDMAARESRVAMGLEWLPASNACPICQAIADQARFVQFGKSFATIGEHPLYSDIKYPPAHPHCRCATNVVLIPAYGGPASVEWTDAPLDPIAALEPVA
jgi:SPP1 gp7 family putative phage head morphogenesis protein